MKNLTDEKLQRLISSVSKELEITTHSYESIKDIIKKTKFQLNTFSSKVCITNLQLKIQLLKNLKKYDIRRKQLLHSIGVQFKYLTDLKLEWQERLLKRNMVTNPNLTNLTNCSKKISRAEAQKLIGKLINLLRTSNSDTFVLKF